ncbi:MAG TPA: ABC transporter substrate-binding protein [Beutenbergiaceae bacterium]|nr:ABC transporter substrate-binding protein [Beutenbergiaceae bacterium]
MTNRTRRCGVPMLAATALILAACGNGGDDEGPGADGADLPPLTVHASSATTWQANFNPFSANALSGTEGFLFEPLHLSTPMQPGEPIPWLAEEMEFTGDGSEVTFTLRQDVTWNDGEPLTADDVAFTFELLIDNPGMNTAAIPLAGTEVIDDHTVQVELTEPAFAHEGEIGNTTVLPEHVWSDVDDPVEFTNAEDPVGTGPFTLGDFSEQLYALEKNEDYWAADEITVEQIEYPTSTDQTLTTSLQAGEYDWAGGFISNIDEIFVDHDPEHRGYWYAGGGTVSLTVNNERDVFTDHALREAMSTGIDRQHVADVAMQGYVPPSHPSALPQPTYDEVIAAEYTDAAFTPDTDEANRILDEAGYELGEDGVRTSPDGERLSWELLINSSYTDWVDIAQILEEQLAEIGVELVPQGLAREAYMDARNHGNFDVTITSVAAGLTPYDLYRDLLSSEYAAEGDDDAVQGNFGRFYDEEADDALAQYRTSGDDAQQQEALETLQRITIEEHPVIPLIQAGNWFNYNTERWSGFPGEDNPYALGAPFQTPDNALIIRELTPTS